jgi:hypothetical protein
MRSSPENCYHALRRREELHRQVELLRGEDPKGGWFEHRLITLRHSELGESLGPHLTALQHQMKANAQTSGQSPNI